MNTRIPAYCPCGCGQVLEGLDAGFSSTTVEIPVCDKAKAAGALYSSVIVRKSAVYAGELSVPAQVYRHKDGLVTLG